MDLFGTAGIRGNVVSDVTPALALKVGRAAGEDGAEFVLGRDGRETGHALVSAVEAGLESAGADVRRLGMVPTPALAFASRGRHGIQLTASHNPPEDNGIKVFEDGVEYDRDGEKRIERRVEEDPRPVYWDDWGRCEHEDVLERYRSAVDTYVQDRRVPETHPSATDNGLPEDPLDGFDVAVDCGNGMASLTTPQVLGRLGADVVTINGSVDGHFPGRPSKPTPKTLSDFREFVAETDTELGIAHDGDADRVVVVDADGEVVHEDTVVAILAEYYTRIASVQDPVVVTTPNASGRIDERVEAGGGRVERVRLGALHEGIHRAEANGGTVVFAAEPWKHIHPAFGRWIDGVTSAALVSVLVASAGGLAELRDPITERPYRKESSSCPDDAKAAAMNELSRRLPEQYPEAHVDTDRGIRLDFDDGSWLLVRPSGTEPYIRLYAESESVDALVDQAQGVIEAAIESVRN